MKNIMESPEAAESVNVPERLRGDSSNTSGFVSGLCQGLKNVNRYRDGMIETLKNKLGNHSIHFRKK
jgi:hypothetical protein